MRFAENIGRVYRVLLTALFKIISITMILVGLLIALCIVADKMFHLGWGYPWWALFSCIIYIGLSAMIYRASPGFITHIESRTRPSTAAGLIAVVKSDLSAIASPFVVSVLATIALAPLEFIAVVWYVSYWDLFPKYSPQRILAWIVFVCSTVIIPICQIKLYRRLNGVEAVDGRYLYVLVFIESAISVALIFYILIRRRRS